MEAATKSYIIRQIRRPESASRGVDAVTIHRIVCLRMLSYDSSNYGYEEEKLLRDLREGQVYFLLEEDGYFVAFASWHPSGEARNGTAMLCDLGWPQGIPGSTVTPLLLAAVEHHAANWFRDRKGSTLRMFYAIVPANRMGARTALEQSQFVRRGTLHRYYDGATDGVYLTKEFPESTPEAV